MRSFQNMHKCLKIHVYSTCQFWSETLGHVSSVQPLFNTCGSFSVHVCHIRMLVRGSCMSHVITPTYIHSLWDLQVTNFGHISDIVSCTIWLVFLWTVLN